MAVPAAAGVDKGRCTTGKGVGRPTGGQSLLLVDTPLLFRRATESRADNDTGGETRLTQMTQLQQYGEGQRAFEEALGSARPYSNR